MEVVVVGIDVSNLCLQDVLDESFTSFSGSFYQLTQSVEDKIAKNREFSC